MLHIELADDLHNGFVNVGRLGKQLGYMRFLKNGMLCCFLEVKMLDGSRRKKDFLKNLENV